MTYHESDPSRTDPHLNGVGRDTSDPSGRTICLYFDRRLTDDALRALHNAAREWRP